MAGLLKTVEASAKAMADAARDVLAGSGSGRYVLAGVPKIMAENIVLSVLQWGKNTNSFCGIAFTVPNVDLIRMGLPSALVRLNFPSALLSGPRGTLNKAQRRLLDEWPSIVTRSWAVEVLSVWAGREEGLAELIPPDDVREVLALGLTFRVMES